MHHIYSIIPSDGHFSGFHFSVTNKTTMNILVYLLSVNIPYIINCSLWRLSQFILIQKMCKDLFFYNLIKLGDYQSVQLCQNIGRKWFLITLTCISLHGLVHFLMCGGVTGTSSAINLLNILHLNVPLSHTDL